MRDFTGSRERISTTRSNGRVGRESPGIAEEEDGEARVRVRVSVEKLNFMMADVFSNGVSDEATWFCSSALLLGVMPSSSSLVANRLLSLSRVKSLNSLLNIKEI